MKSRTSCFNAGLAKNIWRRSWPAWLVFALVMLWIPVMILNRYHDGSADRLDQILLTASTGMPMLMLFVGILAAMLQFSYLYNTRGCGLINTLPIRRETAFGTAYWMGLMPMLLLEVLALLIGLLLSLVLPVKASSFGLWFLITACSTLTFYGIAVFCAMLTGNLLVLPALYFVLNFVGVVVSSCLDVILYKILYGYPGTANASVLYWFSPLMVLDDRISYINLSATDGKMVGVHYAVIYAAAGVLLSLAALLLYRKRRMESATDTVAITGLKPVFKYCMAFGTALVAVSFLSDLFNLNSDLHMGKTGFWLTLLLMLLGAAVGWYVARMVLQKSVRVFQGDWKGLTVICALIVLGCTALECDLFGFERRIPAAEDVTSVRFLGGMELREPENIAKAVELHHRMVEHKERYDGKMAVYNGDSAAISQGFYLRYTLADGSEMYRRYEVLGDASELEDPDSDMSLYKAIWNTHEAIVSNNIPRMPVTEDTLEHISLQFYLDDQQYNYNLSTTEAIDFYENCLLPDIMDERIGRFPWISGEVDYSNVDVYLSLSAALEDYPELADDNMIWHTMSAIGEYKYYQIPMDAGRCLDWIRENAPYEVQANTAEELSFNRGVG